MFGPMHPARFSLVALLTLAACSAEKHDPATGVDAAAAADGPAAGGGRDIAQDHALADAVGTAGTDLDMGEVVADAMADSPAAFDATVATGPDVAGVGDAPRGLDTGVTVPPGSGPAVCAGRRTNLSEDPSHCGSCGTICPPNTYCSAGLCAQGCATALLPTGKSCVDPSTSSRYCAQPGSTWLDQCDANEACKGGSCVAVCDTGQTSCNGTCTVLASDNQSCGACGQACASGTGCMFGACMPCKGLLPYLPLLSAKAPAQVAMADLNGDHKLDLVTSGNGIGVFLGNGDGSFAAERRIESQGGGATVRDLDGDGKLDLIQPVTGAIVVRSGLGDGTFGSERSYPVPSVEKLALGDLNRDGLLDVVVAGGKQRVYVLLGTQEHGLSAATSIDIDPNAQYLALGDLDGDGFVDAAVAGSGSAYVAILFGNGDGTFKQTSYLTVKSGIGDVAAGDLDDDGRAELVFLVESQVRVFYNTVSGLFQERNTGVSVALGSLLLTDLDGDDRLDVLVTGGTSVKVLPSTDYGRSFAAERDVGVGTHNGLAVGDVNGDGRPDLVAADRVGGTLSVVLSNGRGTFARPTLRKLDNYPSAITFADVDADGKVDMVIRRRGMFLISLFSSWSGYGVEQTWTIPSSAGSVIGVADLDGDGKGDIVLGNSEDKSIVFLLSRKGFSSPTNYSYDGMMAALALADFNGDGNIDFASANADSKDITVVLGKGADNLGTSVHYAVAGAPTQIFAADIDGDGKLDLVTPDSSGRAVSILPGLGDGSFGAVKSVSTGGASWIELGDFDGNGIVDLAALDARDSSGKSAVAVLLGTGAGAFSAPKTYPYDVSLSSFSVGDIDGDGHVDLLLPSLGTGTLHFRLGVGDGTFAAPTAPYLLPLTSGIVRLQDLDRDGFADLVMLDSSYKGGLGIVYGIKGCKTQ